jgi:hypothetical protein
MEIHHQKFNDITGICIMLKDQKLTELEVGTDPFKSGILMSKCKALSESILEAKRLYQDIFNAAPSPKMILDLLTEPERKLKDKFIKLNKIEEKFSLIKREKLDEIVDFPDFSKLVKLIQSINDYSIETDEVINIESFFKSNLEEVLETLQFEIEQKSKIIIKGQENIRAFLSTILLVKSFQLFKAHTGVRAENLLTDLKKKRMINVTEFGDIRLDEENLIQGIIKGVFK